MVWTRPKRILTTHFPFQLIEFAYSRSSHVEFGENTRLALSHLYLRGWDAQYETLDYPPAAGPYAIYEKGDFFENIGYALTRVRPLQANALLALSFIYYVVLFIFPQLYFLYH